MFINVSSRSIFSNLNIAETNFSDESKNESIFFF